MTMRNQHFGRVSFDRPPIPGFDDDVSDSEEERASAMIAAPPIRSTPKGFIKEVNTAHMIGLTDQQALHLASRKSKMFSALKKNNIKRRYRRRKKKTKEKPLTDKQKVELDPTQHPYYQQHKIERKVSISKVNPDNVNAQQLRQVLVDFYAFYDPVTSQSEISEILNWTLQNGLKSLNDILIQKYNAGLILTEAIINKNTTIVFRNHKNVVQSARIGRNLTTPGLNDRTNTASANVDSRKVEAAIVVLERSQTTLEIKDSLIDFYRIVEPERLEQWFRGKTKDFISEILAWTFRFGVAQLASNLREKHSLENTRHSDSSLILAPTTKQPTVDPYAGVWTDPVYIAKCLERFYIVYNPGRLERSLQSLIDFILKNGVAKFNTNLQERYNDDLFTFENAEHVRWRGELVQKLFDFFSKVDPPVIAYGLNNLIHWTERQAGKIDALNQYLQEKYQCDLTTLTE